MMLTRRAFTRGISIAGLASMVAFCLMQTIGRGHAAAIPATHSTIGAHFIVTDVVPLPFNLGNYRHTLARAVNGEWFVYPRQWGSGDTCKLYRVGSAGAERVMLPLPDDPAFRNLGGPLRDFSIDDRYIVIPYRHALLIYDRTATGVGTARVIRFGGHRRYDRVHKVGDEWYLTSMDVQDNRPQKTWVCRVDIEKGKLLWERPFPDANGIEFTRILPRRAIELRRNEVIIADLDRYRIMIYDHAGRVLDSLTRTVPGWPIDTSYRRYLLDRDPMDSLRRCAFCYSNIRLITLLDSSTLLVTMEYKESKHRGTFEGSTTRHDIWRRKSGRWRLDVADAEEFKPASGDRWDDHRMMRMGLGYFPMGERMLGQIMPYSGVPFEGRSYASIKHDLDSFFVEPWPPCALIVYRERK